MVFAYCSTVIPRSYAHSVLTKKCKINVSTLPPYQPLGGQIFLFDTRYERIWIADGYRWDNRGNGCKAIEEASNVQKTLYHINSRKDKTRSSKFQRIAYTLTKGSLDYTLVQYYGDETLYIPKPHGNSIHSNLPHTTALPSNRIKSYYKPKREKNEKRSLLTGIADETFDLSTMDDAAMEAEKQEPHHVVCTLNAENFTGVYGLGKLVQHLTLVPTFLAIAGLNEIIRHINGLVQVRGKTPIIFSFHTLSTSEYYISILLCHHREFSSAEPVPVLSILHQKSMDELFSTILQQICLLMPNMKTNKFVLIVNHVDMKSMNNVLKNYCTEGRIVFCWNHLKEWFSKKEQHDLYDGYKDDLHLVLNTGAYWEFLLKYENVRRNWDWKKITDFENVVKDCVKNYSANWDMVDLDIFDEQQGIVQLKHSSWSDRLTNLFEDRGNLLMASTILERFSILQKEVRHYTLNLHIAKKIVICATKKKAEEPKCLENLNILKKRPEETEVQTEVIQQTSQCITSEHTSAAAILLEMEQSVATEYMTVELPVTSHYVVSGETATLDNHIGQFPGDEIADIPGVALMEEIV